MIESKEKRLSIHLNCRSYGEGVFFVILRGKDIRDSENKRVPVMICYRAVRINGESIIDDDCYISHDKPFRWSKPIRDGEEFVIEIEWGEI